METLSLSPQQKLILSKYLNGECIKKIASDLNTTTRVWTNMAKARTRNHLINNAQLCLKAREQGLI